MTHSQIQRQVTDALRVEGWLVVPIEAGKLSYPGIADLYCLRFDKKEYIPRHVWIEIKTEKDTQKDKQKEFERRVKEQKGEYYIVRSLEILKLTGMIENIEL